MNTPKQSRSQPFIIKEIYVSLIIIAALCFVDVVFCPTYTLRYRLSLTFANSTGLHNVSSNMEFKFQVMPEFLSYVGSGSLHGAMHSAAMRVDLGGGNVIYVVNALPRLRGGCDGDLLFPKALSLAFLPFPLFRQKNKATSFNENNKMVIKHLISQQGARLSIALTSLPMVVRFVSKDDPASIEEVDPTRLPSAFGPDTRMVSASIQITDDPPTTVSDQWPSWMKHRPRSELLKIWLCVDHEKYTQIPLQDFTGE